MKRKGTKLPSNYVSSASETSGAAMRKKKREAERKGKEGIELLATDGDWELYTPKTWEGSVYLGRMGGVNAKWDTAYIGEPRWFQLYNDRGPLYTFINKATGEKYQSHPATRSWFYDVNDRELGKEALDNFICEHPAFAEFFDVSCDEDIEGCGDINACGDTKYAADMSNCINCSDDAVYELASNLVHDYFDSFIKAAEKNNLGFTVDDDIFVYAVDEVVNTGSFSECIDFVADAINADPDDDVDGIVDDMVEECVTTLYDMSDIIALFKKYDKFKDMPDWYFD